MVPRTPGVVTPAQQLTIAATEMGHAPHPSRRHADRILGGVTPTVLPRDLTDVLMPVIAIVLTASLAMWDTWGGVRACAGTGCMTELPNTKETDHVRCHVWDDVRARVGVGKVSENGVIVKMVSTLFFFKMHNE